MRRTFRTAVSRARGRMEARREQRRNEAVQEIEAQEEAATQARLDTEEALAGALRAYIEVRATGPIDDMVDDALGAVNQTLAENWSVRDE